MSGPAGDGIPPSADTSLSDGGSTALAALRKSCGERYEIGGELGRGAVGIVFAAYDRETGEKVAIKVLGESAAGSSAFKRFGQEVDIGESVQHVRIVPVIDKGTADGFPWYAMPRIVGPSLRDRLNDDRQLSFDEALRITTEVAEALDCAHAAGVIHRDVKPGNILLGPKGAMLTDFGIARKLKPAPDDTTFTSTGIAVGTVSYMSPEQAAASKDVGPRSDVYALACVLYEMLGGEPPFTGATPQAVMAQHANEKPRSLRVVRPGIPKDVDAAILKALAKVPADRFATTGEFATALSTADMSSTWDEIYAVVPWWRQAAVRVVAGTAIVVGGALLASPTGRESLGLGPVRLDSALVLALAVDSSTLRPAEALIEGFSRWRDAAVVSSIAANDALRSPRRENESAAGRARRAALELHAGRYALTQVIRAGGTTVFHTRLFDTRSDSALAEARVSALIDIPVAVDSLLFRRQMPAAPRDERGPGTSLIAARRAYLGALTAIERGDFSRADSLLLASTEADSDFPQAQYWLARLRVWTRNAQRPWAPVVERALRAETRRRALAPLDSLGLSALRFQMTGKADRACEAWSTQTQLQPHDFAAWYSLAECLRADSAVVRQPAPRVAWKFRSSYEQVLRAYEQAFALQPSLMRGHGSNALAMLQGIFATETSRIRSGRALPPDTQRFIAYPSFASETLAFVPYLASRPAPDSAASSMSLAIQRNRQRLLQAARGWRSAESSQYEAANAVAIALDLLGSPAAIDTIHDARRLARSKTTSTALAATEVLMRVKFALPDDSVGLHKAVALADTLLLDAGSATPEEAEHLAPLAALMGRSWQAARLAAVASPENPPPVLAVIGPRLLTLAAMGGPAAELLALDQQVATAIETLPPDQQRRERIQWLARASMLAFPNVVLGGGRDTTYPGAAGVVAAAIRRDTTRVLSAVDRMLATRRRRSPADMMFDGLLPEVTALHAVGASAAALNQVSATLDQIRASVANDLTRPSRVGALVRCIALRATLAAQQGDSVSARRWSVAIPILWSQSDSHLKSTVAEMQRLAR